MDEQLWFVCLQNNCMSLPVVYLDPMVDQELANRLSDIITKHRVRFRLNDGEDAYTLKYLKTCCQT